MSESVRNTGKNAILQARQPILIEVVDKYPRLNFERSFLPHHLRISSMKKFRWIRFVLRTYKVMNKIFLRCNSTERSLIIESIKIGNGDVLAEK